MKLPTMPNLEGLIRLARQDGVDVRPTLVRVLTDMYVQKRSHTRDEELRFTELASWLLSSVDSATRAAVARKLATCPEAPRAVVRRLAADEFEIAEPVLRQSPCLTSEDLLAIAVECGSRHAEAIAAREARAEVAAQPLGGSDDGSPATANATDRPADRWSPEEFAADAPAQDAAESRRAANARPTAPREGASVGQRFLNADSEERRRILADLAEAAPAFATQVPALTDRDAIVRLEAAAMQERPEDFTRDLQQLLQITRTTADEIVGDARGEPVVVVARAIGMPGNVLLRILLFLNPAIGQSVARVFDLMDLFERITPEAALRLVASWRNAIGSEKRPARYQSLHYDDEARARRPSVDHAWRPATQIPDGRAQPGRGPEGVNTDRRQRTT